MRGTNIKKCVVILILSFVNSASALDFNLVQQFGNSESEAVALADLDGDGDIDAFVANTGFGGPVGSQIWLNDGAGQFSGAAVIGSMNAQDVALGDLDGDGDFDAFLANISTSGNSFNQVWINNSTNAQLLFTDSGQQLGNENSNRVKLADFDQDGDLDALVINSGSYKIWTNKGGSQQGNEGEFELSNQVFVSSSISDVTVGDIDLDSDLDFIITRSDSADMVWINQGGRQFGVAGEFSVGTNNLNHVLTSGAELGDLDGDGDLDLVTTNFFPEDVSIIWINQGLAQAGTIGQFIQGSVLSTGWANDVKLADLSRNGRLDLFFVRVSLSAIWENGGGLTFIDSGLPFSLDEITDMASADLNSDGSLDLVLSNNGAMAPGGPDGVWLNADIAGTTHADLNVSVSPVDSVEETSGSSNVFADFSVLIENKGPNIAQQIAISLNGGNLISDGNFACSTVGDKLVCSKNQMVAGERDFLFLSQSSSYIPNPSRIFQASLKTSVLADTASNDFNLLNNASTGKVGFYNCNNAAGCLIEVQWCRSRSLLRRAKDALVEKGTTGTGFIPDLNLYYQLRHVMNESIQGSTMVDLYYQHTAEMVSLVASNSNLQSEFMVFLEVWEDNFRNLVDYGGKNALISASQVTALDNFLNSLSTLASTELQQAISDERNRIGLLTDYIGQSMSDAKEQIIPGDVVASWSFEELQLQ